MLFSSRELGEFRGEGTYMAGVLAEDNARPLLHFLGHLELLWIPGVLVLCVSSGLGGCWMLIRGRSDGRSLRAKSAKCCLGGSVVCAAGIGGV